MLEAGVEEEPGEDAAREGAAPSRNVEKSNRREKEATDQRKLGLLEQ